MPQRILNEDWSEYDNKKKKGVDARFFSCEESWEVDYLVNKIRKHEPNKSRDAILVAIRSCCIEIPAPRPRERFVRCVMGRL